MVSLPTIGKQLRHYSSLYNKRTELLECCSFSICEPRSPGSMCPSVCHSFISLLLQSYPSLEPCCKQQLGLSSFEYCFGHPKTLVMLHMLQHHLTNSCSAFPSSLFDTRSIIVAIIWIRIKSIK